LLAACKRHQASMSRAAGRRRRSDSRRFSSIDTNPAEMIPAGRVQRMTPTQHKVTVIARPFREKKE